MAGIPAEDLLLEAALPVAAVASLEAEDRSAEEAPREAGESEKAFHARGAPTHRRRDRRDRAKHCGKPARRGDSRQRSLFALSGRMGGHRRDSAGRAREYAPARYREPHHDRDPTVVPDCDYAATPLASDPPLDCTAARQARSRPATRASRIQ